MSQFIYVLKPVRLAMLTDGPTEAEAEAVQAHINFLESQAAVGSVMLAGRTQTADEETFGLVILEADSEAAARLLMASDPAVAGGAMTARLFPYQIAVLSGALKRS